MYLALDVGGTKTLVAVLTEQGVIKEKVKLPTDKDYDSFLKNVRKTLNSLETKEFAAGAIAVTGPRTDREHGVMINSANLPWRKVPIQKDVEEMANCPMVIENDAKLAALSEAMMVKNEFKVVLYVTV